MARKGGLPSGTLDTLIDETNEADSHEPLPLRARSRKAAKVVPGYSSRTSKRKTPPRAASRPTVQWETDPVSRYAASRGLPMIAGPMPAIRLVMQFAMDVREVAKKERTTVFGVVSKALAGYLNAYDRG